MNLYCEARNRGYLIIMLYFNWFMVLLEALFLKANHEDQMSVSKEILFVTWHQFLISFFPSCVSQSRTTGFEISGKYLSLLPIPWQYFITI